MPGFHTCAVETPLDEELAEHVVEAPETGRIHRCKSHDLTRISEQCMHTQAGDEDDDDGAADARMGTGPVPQMQSDADLDAACTQRGGACLIALLDAGDSASLASHLDSLQSIRSTRRYEPWRAAGVC